MKIDILIILHFLIIYVVLVMPCQCIKKCVWYLVQPSFTSIKFWNMKKQTQKIWSFFICIITGCPFFLPYFLFLCFLYESSWPLKRAFRQFFFCFQMDLTRSKTMTFQVLVERQSPLVLCSNCLLSLHFGPRLLTCSLLLLLHAFAHTHLFFFSNYYVLI